MSTSADKNKTLNIWKAKEDKPDKPLEDSKANASPVAKKSHSRPRKEKSYSKAKVEHHQAPKNDLFDSSRIRKHNVIIVRKNTAFKTLVIRAKDLLKKQFNTVELHAVDEQSYLTITLVAQCLLKYKYVTLSRLKTKTVQIYDDEERKGNDDPMARLQPRLIAHLTKTKEFDDIYDDFEFKFKKMLEENKEEIDKTQQEIEPEDLQNWSRC